MKNSANSTTHLDIADKMQAENPNAELPTLGVRVKLYSKGSGKWEKSVARLPNLA
ncbi:MAG: hypothetical protein IPG22_06115 [Acidobacteria bacterium]|nr:hypothetical protein [Acidobacteriota bacterium]